MITQEERDNIAGLLFDLEADFYEISEKFKKLGRILIRFEIEDSTSTEEKEAS